MADTIDTLNDLISSCRDSEEGFGKAAKGVHSENLRDRFAAIARERADFADELAGAVRRLSGEPAPSAHESSVLHRGWLELEASIRPKDDATFLVECLSGEENTLRHYEHALTEELPDDIRLSVDRQRLRVQTALLELRGLVQLRKTG